MTEPDYSAGAAFIEGQYCPIGEARIPILDAGFLRSDCTYDVVHVWKGSFFRLDAHMQRFEKSYRALRLHPPRSLDEIREAAIECVRLSGLRDAYVAVIATRGMPRSLGSRDPGQYAHAFYAYAIPFVWIATPTQQDEGWHAIISTVRRIPPESVDPTVKNFHWGDLVRGAFEAKAQGAVTAVLVDENDNVTEGIGYNVFAVVDGALLTPRRGVLEGITRATVLELAESEGIEARLCDLPAAVFRNADELFATSTAGGVMPISKLEGRPVGDGTPGPLTRRIRDLYWAAHDDPRWSTPVAY